MKNSIKKTKGITLVALVITIIVMLILVGVTLNIALDDNGIIQKAKDTRIASEEESIYEQIIAAGIYGRNGIDLDATKNNITSMEGCVCGEISNNQFTVTATGKYGTYTYTVTKNEIIKGTVPLQQGDFTITALQEYNDTNTVTVNLVPGTYYSQQEAESILLAKAEETDPNFYFNNNMKLVTVFMAKEFDENLSDIPIKEAGYDMLCEAIGLTNTATPEEVVEKMTQCTMQEFVACIYKDPQLTETLKINNASSVYDEFKPFGLSGLGISTEITSNGVYTFEITIGAKTATQTITISSIEENLGKYVWYDLNDNEVDDGENEHWIVLYNSTEYGTQLMSSKPLGSVTLGYDDSIINMNNATDIDNSGTIDNVDKAIYSYNNAVTSLNTYCHNNYINSKYVAYARNFGCSPLYGTATGVSNNADWYYVSDTYLISQNFEYPHSSYGAWFLKYENKIKKTNNEDEYFYGIDEYKQEMLGTEINEEYFKSQIGCAFFEVTYDSREVKRCNLWNKEKTIWTK